MLCLYGSIFWKAFSLRCLPVRPVQARPVHQASQQVRGQVSQVQVQQAY